MSAGEFTRVMTWLPNSQELVFAAGNTIVIMHSKFATMHSQATQCLDSAVRIILLAKLNLISRLQMSDTNMMIVTLVQCDCVQHCSTQTSVPACSCLCDLNNAHIPH